MTSKNQGSGNGLKLLLAWGFVGIPLGWGTIQTLINAMSSATDQKGVLDLQARINVELGMLQNEQAKLQALSQAFDAQEAVLRQQQREQAIAAQGNFAARFQPVP